MNFTDTLLALCSHQNQIAEHLLSSSQQSIRTALGENTPCELLLSSPLAESFQNRLPSCRILNLFTLPPPNTPHYDLLFHQDGLHRFTLPQIHALLAQQVTLATRVAFRVPTAHFPANQIQPGERLLTLPQWREILTPFKVEQFLPLGENQEHLCVVLTGQKPTKALRSLLAGATNPFPFGISAIVHTRNEAHNIAECLHSLQGWTDEIIVCDMESEDNTLEIARPFTARILNYPRIPNFDSARNASAFCAKYRWILYIDADERVPQGLGELLRSLLEQEGESFSALLVPYQTRFLGEWLHFLGSVYKATGFFKNGCFWYDPRPHAGVQVKGETRLFTPQNPHQCFIHLAYRDLHHYLEKYNFYTDTEAKNRFTEGDTYQWQTATRAFVQAFHAHYDGMQAHQDRVHGYLYSFLAGLYRWTEQAKLFEHRFQTQALTPKERGIPRNTREVLEYALQVLDEQEALEAKAMQLPMAQTPPLAVRWEGAQLTWHSLAHVNRELCLALLKTGQVELSLIPTQADLFTAKEYPQFLPLAERYHTPLSRPAEVHIRHSFPPQLTPVPEGHFVLIQAWEYGSLPKEWISPLLERVSEVWCYSETVRSLYRAAGVPEERLALVPLGVDTQVFHPHVPPYSFARETGIERFQKQRAEQGQPFVFLFVGGTLWRKGVDILLNAYLNAFTPQDNVCLVFKDMGTQTFYLGMNYREKIRALIQDPSLATILYTEEDIAPERLASLYATADCLVQPYRGEGFCLPVLEAMACGTPAIVPKGGPTDDFVDESVGWQIPAECRPLGGNRVDHWECVGETWMLEVKPEELAQKMREVYTDREQVKRRGERACQRVQQHWTWRHVAELALQRLYALRGKPLLPRKTPLPVEVLPALPARQETPRKGGLRISRSLTTNPLISVCMIVKNEERVLEDCLQSLQGWANEIIVVDTGSTDNTVAIAEQLGAKVFHFPWTNSFSEARNESLRHATGEWVLWVDADDTVPPESAQEIVRVAKEAPSEVLAFVIPVQFVEDGTSHGGTCVDHVKLIRNVEGICFEGRIHEQILPSLRQLGGEIARCNAVVLHSGYDTSPEGQARKRERDMTILHLELQERPNHPFVLFCLGMTYHYMGEHEKAILWLEKCLSVAEPTESIVRKAYALLALSYREQDEIDKCLQTLKAGLVITPDDPELNFHSGFTLSSLGRYSEAKQSYERAVCADISGYFTSVDKGILGHKTYHNLAGVCLLMEDYAQAKTYWLKAIESMPAFLPSAFEMFQSSLQREDFVTSQLAMECVYRIEGMSESWVTMGLQLVEKTGGAGEQESFLEECLRRDAGASSPRLHLARLLLHSGREQEAEGHLGILNQQGVAESAYYLGVSAVRRGELRLALLWMERALELNPNHGATREQVGNLRQALQEAEG